MNNWAGGSLIYEQGLEELMQRNCTRREIV